MKIDIPLPDSLKPVLEAFDRVLIVGGAVRDQLLGKNPKDLDVEVYSLTQEQLEAKLRPFGNVELVGASFGVYKLTTHDGMTHDFSLPRRDNKIPGGTGHKAFTVEFDPTITEKEAASRRDLTINALAWNPKNGEVLDFFGGLDDLNNKVLRHTSIHFQEDPLRPLRIFQFAARMNFTVDPDTANLCRTMAHLYPTIAKERVGEEFNKFLLKGINHNAGFRALSEMGWMAQFPELLAIERFPQDKEFHPEGDVLTHTGHCLTALSKMPRWQALNRTDKLVTMYGMLCHDLGKATTSILKSKKKLGRDVIASPGHDRAGIKFTKSFLERINVPKEIQARAASLVCYHMEHLQVKSDWMIRRLAVQLEKETIERLGMIVEGDMSGRPPLPAGQAPDMQHIIDRAEAMGCRHGAPKPILQGQNLLDSGLKPGKAVGVLLKAAYEAQLKGAITDQESAMAWIRKHRGPILEGEGLAPKKLLTGEELRAALMPPGPDMGKLHRDLFDQQMDGHLLTRRDAMNFVAQNAKDYHLDEGVISRLEKICEAPVPSLAKATPQKGK